TVIAIAIPAIVTDFNTFSGLSWIGTAYFLASTPLIPTYGKLADIFGRKPVFIVGITLFKAGSLICGLAPSMPVLIVGRAVAGLGGGGMLPMVVIIISDVVPLRDRPKFQGIIGACFGLASVAVGGAFTDKLSWQWCFLINLPVGALTVFVVLVYLRLPLSLILSHSHPISNLLPLTIALYQAPVTQPHGDIHAKLRKINLLGTFWLSSTAVLIVYALTAGGVNYAWSSAPIKCMIVLAVFSAFMFVFLETKFVKHPLIPRELLENRHVIAAWICAFFLGMTFYSM
ncbi:MFS general substrate transporter, partial [Gonapodya prolifera JEL478]